MTSIRVTPPESSDLIPPIPAEPLHVTIVKIDVPFVDLVIFIFKWAFASIPAGVVLWLIVMQWLHGLG
jgi:hypothetical protein